LLVFIIGGGEIYKQCLNLANTVYITEIDCEVQDADTWFLKLDADWKIVHREAHPSDSKNEYSYNFITYERYN
jgi:dihydrofolate reductase